MKKSLGMNSVYVFLLVYYTCHSLLLCHNCESKIIKNNFHQQFSSSNLVNNLKIINCNCFTF